MPSRRSRTRRALSGTAVSLAVVGTQLLSGCAATAAGHSPVARAVTTMSQRGQSSPDLGWAAAVKMHGQSAVEYRQFVTPGLSPITVLRVDQTLLHLHLHAGSIEPAQGLGGWKFGPSVGGAERAHLVAAFNGGFKMADVRGGWVSEGRVVVPLRAGAPSVVIHSDGSADVLPGDGRSPAATALIAASLQQTRPTGRTVVSERQNVGILVQDGVAVSTHGLSRAEVRSRWGRTFQGAQFVARSGLGITRDGRLVWAASDRTSVDALAAALRDAGAVRAIQLDINAPLVRGFLFPDAAGITAQAAPLAHSIVPLVVGQTPRPLNPLSSANAPHCDYLTPCSRDFFTLTTS